MAFKVKNLSPNVDAFFFVFIAYVVKLDFYFKRIGSLDIFRIR